jgi:hypothetical protein
MRAGSGLLYFWTTGRASATRAYIDCATLDLQSARVPRCQMWHSRAGRVSIRRANAWSGAVTGRALIAL